MRKILFLGAVLAFPLLSQAQTAKFSGFKFSGASSSYRPNGVRLEGSAARPARVQSPQLDVQALGAIGADLVSGTSLPTQIRATGGVSLKVNFPARGGNPSSRIEATSTTATLTTATRTLVLKGNLKGFYQLGDGPQNPISGESATFVVDKENNINAQIEGGARGVSLSVPASGFGAGTANLSGTILITAAKASVDQKTGEAIFSGNARAKSSGTPQDFEVSAPSFTVSRASDGQLSKLVTSGKTSVKLDLPPDATSANSSFGKPTRVEIQSNSARVDFPTSTGVFEGNVSGFYRLKPTTGAAQDYRFSGGRAVITFKDALGVDVTGEPVSIETPGVEF